MSDNHRLPIDEIALDDFWDDLVAGSAANRTHSIQLPADVVQAIRTIAAIDPAPWSSSVRERAWAETWERIQHVQSERESPMNAHAFPVGQRHERSSGESFLISRSRTIPRAWVAAAGLLAAVFVAIAGFVIFGPDRSGPHDGPVIPAVVVPDATPTGEHIVTIDLPASMVHSTGDISAGWEYTEFDGPVRWEYRPNCCPGPFVEYVLEGQFIVKNTAPMTVSRAGGTTEAIPANTEVTLNAGDAFLAENFADMDVRNPLRTDGHTLGWVLVNDARFDGHGSWAGSGIPAPAASDLHLDMQVSPGPGQLIVTRYVEFDDIPAAPPNSHQFVLQITGNADGTPIASSTLVPTSGTPFPTSMHDGYYVLVFQMSAPGTASPEASPAA